MRRSPKTRTCNWVCMLKRNRVSLQSKAAKLFEKELDVVRFIRRQKMYEVAMKTLFTKGEQYLIRNQYKPFVMQHLDNCDSNSSDEVPSSLDCNPKLILRTKLCKGIFPQKAEEPETPMPLSAHLVKANSQLTSGPRRESIVPEGTKSFTSSAEISAKLTRLKAAKSIELGSGFPNEDIHNPEDNLESK